MKSSLKIKINKEENEFSITTSDGHNLLEGLLITEMVITANAANVPKVTFSCVVFEELEIEYDEAEIEVHETKVRK